MKSDLSVALRTIRENRVLVAGSVNSDIIINFDQFPDDDGSVLIDSVVEAPGGHGGNCAVALSRLGAQVTLLGSIGHDSAGSRLADELGREVNTRYLVASHSAKTGCVTIPNGSDKKIMLMDRGANDAVFDWEKILEEVKLEQFSSVVLLDPSIQLATCLIDRLKEGGRVVPLLWAPGAIHVGEKIFAESAHLADTVILNRAEMATAFPFQDNGRFAFPGRPGLKLLIGTDGSNGSRIYSDGVESHVLPFKVDTVDEVGAGDAFIAAYCIYANVLGFSSLDATKFANFYAAQSTRKSGARSGYLTFVEVMTSYIQCKNDKE